MDDFELTVDELRARRGRKWTQYGPAALPAWIADMDFSVAPPVQAAIRRLVEQQDYGYGDRFGDDSLAAAFVRRMQDRFGWTPDRERVQLISELIQGMHAAVYAFSEPGDGVVVQTPIYPPFLQTISTTGRRVVDNPLVDDGHRLVIDGDGLRRAIDGRTRILLFCNPHNPAGRVFSRDELLAVSELAVERDLIVVSDEIHADLVYDGRRHIPLATLGPEIAARTITLTSATKSFNIAGLRCALVHFGSPALHERFRKVFPDRLLGQVSIVGVDATIAAWREGQPWLAAVMARLQANRDRLTRFLADELPAVGYRPPEGTYLAWLDCHALDLPAPPCEFFLKQAGVAFSDGAAFGPNGRGCVRLNFATSAPILEQILARLAAAVRQVRA